MARKFITGGTVSVSNGSTVVTGVGTAFTSVAASEFWFAGLSVLLDTVTDDEDLTLSAPWPGATLVNETAYQLWIDGEGAAVALDTNHKVRALLEALTLKGAILYGDGVPGAGLGDDDDTYFDETAGKMYRKVSGAWVLRWTGTITSADVSNLVVLTQAAYDALGSQDANTFYATTEA